MQNNLLIIIKLLSLSIIGVCRSRNRSKGQNVLCIEARQNPYCINDPLTQDSPIHEHLRKHGDGVKVAAYGLKMLQVLMKKL
jgi:hypothetical protein